SYGLGEMVVQGAVNPDEFYLSKVLLEQNRPAVIRRNLGSKQNKDSYQVPLSKVLSRAREVIRHQVNTHKLFYERNQIQVIH
ncbi:PEP/pyruvate-binding domain-containing protein, partial [Moraxella catarrhalis]|uniref:PEP/pyruvate-binding domain-containing protein n=1 Tax=Moraxella catarrhalis TaxID=480 RepID=UPI00217ECD83